jgi:hypothetical protein
MNDDIISKLKFIGTIRKGEKISVKNLYIQKNNIFTQLHRTFLGREDREATLNFIITILEATYALYLAELDTAIKKYMIIDIKNARDGIINLTQTYAIDNMYTCRLNFILQKLDVFLSRHDTQ